MGLQLLLESCPLGIGKAKLSSIVLREDSDKKEKTSAEKCNAEQGTANEGRQYNCLKVKERIIYKADNDLDGELLHESQENNDSQSAGEKRPKEIRKK